MAHSSESDALQPMLQHAEADLAQRLEEACAMHDVHDESTGELMRLEETLLDAARAAKQAVSVRRRLRALGTRASTSDGADRGDGAATAASVRDFVDEQRVEWRVWEVIPSPSRSLGRAGPALGEYQAGWLAFEAVDSGRRRRLRDYPHDWNRLPNEALEALLRRAEPARDARRSSGARNRPDAPPP